MHRLAVTILLVLAAAPCHAATSWDFSSGLDYSEGRYGAARDTSVWSIPLSGRVQMDRLRLEAYMPYLNIRGPGVLVGGSVVGTNSVMNTRSGMGDLTLGAAYLLHADEARLPSIELAGSVKVPTASLELGTGKLDYNLQANINHSFSPRLMLFGSLGYSWLNDYLGYRLEDGMTATAGVNYRASNATSIGISANYREPYYQGLGPQFTVTPYALWRFASRWRVTVYGLTGYSAASPRAGGGVRLTFFQ
jgi:hypothetical protein